MFKKKLHEIKALKKTHPSFFLFAAGILILYFAQFAARTEITPLGYFALYSDPMKAQETYKQILPACPAGSATGIANIYKARGQGFLMLEILPTRYDILLKSDHCNQMNHRLQRLGFHDTNKTDCDELTRFREWFNVYMDRIGIDSESCEPVEFGFRDGEVKTFRLLNSTSENELPK